jgi:hypothetical protein
VGARRRGARAGAARSRRRGRLRGCWRGCWRGRWQRPRTRRNAWFSWSCRRSARGRSSASAEPTNAFERHVLRRVVVHHGPVVRVVTGLMGAKQQGWFLERLAFIACIDISCQVIISRCYRAHPVPRGPGRKPSTSLYPYTRRRVALSLTDGGRGESLVPPYTRGRVSLSLSRVHSAPNCPAAPAPAAPASAAALALALSLSAAALPLWAGQSPAGQCWPSPHLFQGHRREKLHLHCTPGVI